MAKVFVGVGHEGKDCGVVGYLVEKYVNLVKVSIYQGFLEAHSARDFMSYAKNDTLTEKTCGGNELSPGLAKTKLNVYV